MPGASLEVPILFTPREIRKYSETIKLDFDGLYQVEVQVHGQGTALNLGLKDPEQ
jgi:hydrocephalus-inducing protein